MGRTLGGIFGCFFGEPSCWVTWNHFISNWNIFFFFFFSFLLTRSGNTSVPNPTKKIEELRVLSYQLWWLNRRKQQARGCSLTSSGPFWGFPGGSDDKKSACNAGDLGWSLGWKIPLEKEMATHFSILACRIPLRTAETGGLHTVNGVTKSRTRLSD